MPGVIPGEIPWEFFPLVFPQKNGRLREKGDLPARQLPDYQRTRMRKYTQGGLGSATSKLVKSGLNPRRKQRFEWWYASERVSDQTEISLYK